MNEKNLTELCIDSNHELNADLLTLLIIWTKHKESLYVPYFEPFIYFATYLDCQEIMGSFIPKSQAPDICAKCLYVFGMVVTGRVRNGCCNCPSLEWNEGFYNEPWPGRMATILNISLEYLEFHMAYALAFHKELQEKWIEQDKQKAQNVRPRRFNLTR